MDLATALAISARFMDVHAARLRAVAESLDHGAGPVGAAGPGRRTAGRVTSDSDCMDPSGTSPPCLAANLDALGATRAFLSRTVDALR